MAHFAELDENNIVLRVIVISNEDIIDKNGNESEDLGIQKCLELFNGGKWIQTSYNNKFRMRYAGIGMKYFEDKDAFGYAEALYPSWIFNEETLSWDPPVAKPTTGGPWMWDEASLSWVEFNY